MLRLFKYIGFAIRFAPIVVSVVTLVEGITSKETSGKDKKALAVATVRDVLGTLGVTMSADLESFVGSTIDAAVSLLNLLGVFKHRDDEPAEDAEVEKVIEVSTVEAPKVAEVAKVLRGQSDLDAKLDELEAALRQ